MKTEFEIGVSTQIGKMRVGSVNLEQAEGKYVRLGGISVLSGSEGFPRVTPSLYAIVRSEMESKDKMSNLQPHPRGLGRTLVKWIEDIA